MTVEDICLKVFAMIGAIVIYGSVAALGLHIMAETLGWIIEGIERLWKWASYDRR